MENNTTPESEVLTEIKSYSEEELTDMLKVIEDHIDSLKKKVYPVKLESKERLDELINFIENDAKWKDREALGIIEVSKALNSSEIKGGNIFVVNLVIEAISYFLGKVEKTGLAEAKNHVFFIKAIDEALKLIKQDNMELESKKNDYVAAKQGIAVDDSTETKND